MGYVKNHAVWHQPENSLQVEKIGDFFHHLISKMLNNCYGIKFSLFKCYAKRK